MLSSLLHNYLPCNKHHSYPLKTVQVMHLSLTFPDHSARAVLSFHPKCLHFGGCGRGSKRPHSYCSLLLLRTLAISQLSPFPCEQPTLCPHPKNSPSSQNSSSPHLHDRVRLGGGKERLREVTLVRVGRSSYFLGVYIWNLNCNLPRSDTIMHRQVLFHY